MTRDPGQFGDATLDDYLDGLLDEEATGRFEERIKADRELRAEVERQTAMNDALQSMCTPSPEVEQRVAEAVRKAAAATPVPIARAEAVPFYRRRWAIAALLALGVVAGWRLAGVIEQRRLDRDAYGPKPWTSMETYYRDAVERGFDPEWVCKDDDEFTNAFKKRLRQPLLVAATTGPVVGLGLGYANCLTARTMTYLARVQGKPVVVFVDKLKKDTHPKLPPNSGLNLFRKELDRLVLYEVSPLAKPYVLDLFYVPE